MSRAPQRIQRKRTKGWKMPEGAQYAGRPTKWGNPYKVGQKVGPNAYPMSAIEARSNYRDWLESCNEYSVISVAVAQKELRGKDLACWCHICDRHKYGLPLGEICHDCDPCHVDILLEVANA